MLWWRLKSFWQPFWRFLVWGNSARDGVFKVIALIILLGGLTIGSIWEAPGYLYFYILHREILSTPISFGVFLTILFSLAWILFAAGRAYELAGIPELVIADDLVADEVMPSHFFFRLGLMSKSEDFNTTVRLIEVLDTDQNRLLPGRFPIELEWSNHPEQTGIHLNADVAESVSLAAMQPRTLGDYELIYTGARHRGGIKLAIGEKAYFHLRIEHRKRKPIERWFCFEKTSNSSFSFEPCAKPQANPA